MEILKDFGVNPILLIAQIVNFLIIFYLLKRFAYKPILEIIKKRELDIKKGIEDAQEGQRVLEDAEAKEQKILKTAQAHAEKIISDARIQAEEVGSEIERKAQAQADKLLIDAKSTIEQETKNAEKELMTKVSGVAVEILESSLSNLFDKKQQKALIKKAADRIGARQNG